MKSQPEIVILLSTYNGDKYLVEQLESLLKQSYSNFIIIIRDDGSSDETQKIITDYVTRNRNKIYSLPFDQRNIGPSASFCLLIQYALEEKESFGFSRIYMMLCDQDDIWMERKIEIQVSEMLSAEQETDGWPILIHSNLRVVDAKKMLIAESFIKYQGLEIYRNRFTNIILSNLVTGCTSFFNEELARKALPIPAKAIMHDWWLALTATAFGKLIFIDEPLVNYRQHGSNTIGAKEFSKFNGSPDRLWEKLFAQKRIEHLIQVSEQAFEFRGRFGNSLSTRAHFCLWISSMMSRGGGIWQRALYKLARFL